MIGTAGIGMGITPAESGIHLREIENAVLFKNINIDLSQKAVFKDKLFYSGKQLRISKGDGLVRLSCPHDQLFLGENGNHLMA